MNQVQTMVDALMRHKGSAFAFIDAWSPVLTKMRTLPREAIPELVGQLGSDAHSVRTVSGWLLLAIAAEGPDLVGQEVRERVTEVLSIALQEEEADALAWPCLLLAFGHAPQSTWAVLRDLESHADERISVCASAALTMADAAEGQTIEFLGRALHLDDRSLSSKAAMALVKLGRQEDAAVSQLVTEFSRVDRSRAVPVIMALSEVGPRAHAARQPLSCMIKDRECDPYLRCLALYSIGSIVSGKYAGLLDGEGSDSEAAESLKEVVELCDILLASPEPEDRLIAVSALAVLGDLSQSTLPRLILCLEGENHRNILAALHLAFTAIGPASIPFLLDHVAARDLQRIPVSMGALVALGSPSAEQIAKRLPHVRDYWFRMTLLLILRDLKTKAECALPVLAEMLNQGGQDDDERLYAIEAINATGQPVEIALPGLIASLARERPDVAAAAHKALVRIGLRAQPTIESAMLEVTGITKERMQQLLIELRSMDDERFKRFEQIEKDALIVLFVDVVELLVERGRMAFTQIAEELPRLQVHGIWSLSYSSSASSILGGIKLLEESWKIPIIRRKEGQIGEVTNEAIGLLPEANEYVAQKIRLLRKQ